ncbi:elongator complex protein 6-like [Acropora millepora]|uniref:elongator complex protein 6-like n=1 Tax=Acropora millepora TaxID=45264 RepID=UPI001CF278B1|nr:elongator complex protein 6-like [Acropora millepora]
MFADFNSLMNFSEKSPPKNKFVLISDAQNDASFIIHHFLSMYIKGGLRVIFLALVQSFSHYNNVAQKLGANLRNAVQNGQVIYLDGLKLISEALDEGNQKKSLDNQQFFVEVDGCLVTLVHNDSDVEDEESLLLWRQLCYEAHVGLHVRGLKSGYCKDVHGQLTITQRDENRMKHRTREVQFKILEKNVTFFAPGMSKAVL